MLHEPVLLKEILSAFKEGARPFASFLDGTFGRGGHARAILDAFPKSSLLALDRDLDAVSFAKSEMSELIAATRFEIRHESFREYALKNEALGLSERFDGILLDLGVSSPQLDTPTRGFSFQEDGPLDMRMNQNQHLSASEIINTWEEEDLIELFKKYGEVFKPYRLVRAIVHDRRERKFETTRQLASLCERVDGWAKRGRHPATQYFMALRLKVNEELAEVEEGLMPLMKSLKPGGRMAVITFHSLEDRIVKNIFRERKDLGRPVNKKVLIPSREEELRNPRSRSAKLRLFERNQT